MNECIIEGCVKRPHARNLCPMHYQRMRLHGDINYRQSRDPGAIARRFWEKVVKGESCWGWTGSIRQGAKGGYANFHVIDRDVVAHRYSYEIHKGPIPPEMVVDHICHNRTCVNPDHLRLATNKQNAENRAGANAGSKSGVRGVNWDSRSGKWKAHVTHHYTRYCLGYFNSIEEAAAVVKAKRSELFTHSIEAA